MARIRMGGSLISGGGNQREENLEPHLEIVGGSVQRERGQALGVEQAGRQ